MNVHKGWVGAFSKEQAETQILEMYPGAQIDRLYEKIKGMWSYEVALVSKIHEEIEDYRVYGPRPPDEDHKAEDEIENTT